MSSRYYIGLEAVGLRHSTAALANDEGVILSACRRSPGISLHTTPRRELRCRLLELLKNVVDQANYNLDILKEATICIGLTGVTFPYDAEVELPSVVEELNLGCQKLICCGDIEIAFAGLTQSEVGTAILCHMGSTAYVANKMLRKRFGGWGPAIGDEGSGYAMGRDTLREIGYEYERGDHNTLLWDEVRRWLETPDLPKQYPLNDWRDASHLWHKQAQKFHKHGIDNEKLRAAIFEFSHNMIRERGVWSWRSVASSLTIPLMRAYNGGDKIAGKIVERAASHLVWQHTEVCKVNNFEPNCGPLALYGGVITHNECFSRLLKEKLIKHWSADHAEYSGANIITTESDGALRPVCGALLFALGNSSSSKLRLPNPNLVETFARQKAFDERPELLND